MGLTPEEIERREFASTLRGYDRDEVRSFLSKVGQTVRDLQEEVADVQTRAEDEQGVMGAASGGAVGLRARRGWRSGGGRGRLRP